MKDPTGTVIPGTDIEMINDGAGTTPKVTTSSAGVFNVPNLDIGAYCVRASGAGFIPNERCGPKLAANQILNVTRRKKGR
jgi:hypothetical protein